MRNDLRDEPIVLQVLPHTGKLQGDDGKGDLLPGYRGFPFIDEDETDPDQLVDLKEEGYLTLPVYANGFEDDRVTGGRYKGGIGGHPRVLLRKPAANALHLIRAILYNNGLDVLCLDGYRPVEVQRGGFQYLVRETMTTRHPGKTYMDLSLEEQFVVGLAADDVFAYVNPLYNEAFQRAVEDLPPNELELAAKNLGKSAGDIAEEIITFRANLGLSNVLLDPNTPMAHRGGGALDMFPFNIATGAPALLGVPFDYPSPAGIALTPSALHYFEDEASWAEYREIANRDPLLRHYLDLNGVGEVTPKVCREIRGIRRVMFHAADEAECTHYLNESFHFNLRNKDGNQEDILPGGGNTCQSLLRNVRDTRDGLIKGNWMPKVADRLAAKYFGIRPL